MATGRHTLTECESPRLLATVTPAVFFILVSMYDYYAIGSLGFFH